MFRFTVHDEDGDPLTVNINYNKQFDLVELRTNNYSLVLKDTLDRETKSRYDLQITISDGVQTVVCIRQPLDEKSFPGCYFCIYLWL